MSNDEDLSFVEIEGSQVSLADLAGMDLSDQAEKRQSSLPAGTYIFEVENDSEGKPPGFRKIGDKVAYVFPLKVIDVVSVKDPKEAPNGDTTQLIGKTHRESLFITNTDSIAYLTAFFVDMGVGKKGSIKDLGVASVGAKFQGTIKVTSKKDDPDTKYHNLDRNQGKIIPSVKRAA